MRVWFVLLSSVALAACQAVSVDDVQQEVPTEPDGIATLLEAGQTNPALGGADIIANAHAAAGGDIFVEPGSLFLSGYNVIYTADGSSKTWDRYAMWRVFGDEKADAHSANGKVRIEAWEDGELAMLISFDGTATYNQSGRMEDQSANAMWSNNFGFGAIRNALDEGWTQTRRSDRTIDGKPAHMVQLTDPSGGKTLFGFEQETFQILYVGFDTPRGWHERRYSEYFSQPGSSWQQAGRVRLFYDGDLSNEAVWTDFEIGGAFATETFVISAAPEAPTFD